MKIKDVFYGVMLGILIPSKYIQGELQRKIKIDYDGIEFPVQEKYFIKIKTRNICINVFGFENRLTFPIYVLEEKLMARWICCM